MLIVVYCLIVIGYTWDLTLTPGKYIWPYLYVLFWSILAWLLHVNVVIWLLHVKLQVKRAQRWCSILNHCDLRKRIELYWSWPITSKNPTIISYSSGEFHQHSNKLSWSAAYLSFQWLQFLNHSIKEAGNLAHLDWYWAQTICQIISCTMHKWYFSVNHLLCCSKLFVENLIWNLNIKIIKM